MCLQNCDLPTSNTYNTELPVIHFKLQKMSLLSGYTLGSDIYRISNWNKIQGEQIYRWVFACGITWMLKVYQDFKGKCTLTQHNCLPFSVPEKIEMILFLGFFSSGTEGRGFKLWLADKGSLLPELKIVLLILTGGAGGLSSSSPLSDMIRNG